MEASLDAGTGDAGATTATVEPQAATAAEVPAPAETAGDTAADAPPPAVDMSSVCSYE
jgi:hypothetical protein